MWVHINKCLLHKIVRARLFGIQKGNIKNMKNNNLFM